MLHKFLPFPFFEKKGNKKASRFLERKLGKELSAKLRFASAKSKLIASMGQKNTKRPAYGCTKEGNQAGLSLKNEGHASAFLCMHRRGGGIIPTPLNMRFKIVSFCHIA